MNKDALLEIGSEELPASFIGIGMRQLKTVAEETLKSSGLSFGAIETLGTPRRLAVVIRDLTERSSDQKKTIIGPPAAMARDEKGQWTPAALGFARKQGVKPSDLTLENGRLTAVLHIKGTAARQLLSDLMPAWIARLEFPKSMVWEPSKFRYPRPIRWIAALYGTEAIAFQVAGVRAGKWTYGLGVSPKKIALSQPSKYALVLKNQCVLADPADRQQSIRRQLEQAAKRLHGQAVMNEALIDQVANLVEHPVAVAGQFDPVYLDLPTEVLITCLEHHQRFFPVEGDKAKKLLPSFVGIRNGMSVHQDIVREGYERVLTARLADARFFFEQDRRRPLKDRVEALKGVVFQQKLGTMFEKKERIRVLVSWLAERAGVSSETRTTALRAAELCKTDLVTDMVREFPELQGVTARLYALTDGEPPEVAAALEQHYWPITLTSALPGSEAAALVALADKMDTLAGDFAIGLIPTGSADPYGLRRTAVGILRILEARSWALDLDEFLERALAGQSKSVRPGTVEAEAKLAAFLRQRLSAVLEDRGFRFDEVDAVLDAGLRELPNFLARLGALKSLRQRPEFEPLSVAFKRAANIVRQAAKSGASADSAVSPELLQEPAEQQLFTSLQRVEGEVDAHAARQDYEKALAALAPLREPLDAFFTGVMVMAEDPALRANRIALMRRLVAGFSKIADFSKLQNERR